MPRARERPAGKASGRCWTPSAFPDHHYTVEDVISEGDKFAVRLTASGTHLGDFFGIPPTGRHATWTETRIVRVVDGKVVDHWANTDSLGMLRQLGVLPEPGRTNW
ncbi:MAG TPA: ester cyclase [Mycobacteriales bacterium]|nr:ester cyclase [Mycobacteriales bacterium]